MRFIILHNARLFPMKQMAAKTRCSGSGRSILSAEKLAIMLFIHYYTS
ncbi:MAG: hypothetical protein NC176_02345 [Treponema brennaborense]|nr:hypothetical protein [Prevotella sp.]MCM1407309.1 hypothetical protein [Treponema brennaborense]